MIYAHGHVDHVGDSSAVAADADWARQVATGAGNFRLACHLVELAVQAGPDLVEAYGARTEIQGRRDDELSLMAKGIYAAADIESSARAEETP